MPFFEPGTLDDQAYADVIAYLLARNGFLAGETPLPADPAALEAIGFFQQ